MILAILITLLPPCTADDGTPPPDTTICAWNATTQGNHTGQNFINWKAN